MQRASADFKPKRLMAFWHKDSDVSALVPGRPNVVSSRQSCVKLPDPAPAITVQMISEYIMQHPSLKSQLGVLRLFRTGRRRSSLAIL